MAIETNELIDVQTLSPFKRFIMTIGNLPTSYLESMSYGELLMWFCNYLQETVIPTVNNNALAVEELQSLYTELHDYVEDYFDNLDIQDEVDAKIDELVTNGTFTTLIEEYCTPFIEAQNEEIDEFKDDVNEQIDEIESTIASVVSGSPKGVYDTVSDLTTADPDHSYIYIVLDDGNWYYYNTNDSEWTAGGIYESTSDHDEVVNIRTGYNDHVYASAGDAVRGQISDLHNLKHLKLNINAKHKPYYANIENVTSNDLVNYPARIGINLDKGVCYDSKYIHIYDSSNVSIPFTFEEVFDENLFVNTNYSYYNDNSIRCGNLVILANIDANENETYHVIIDNNENNFTPAITRNTMTLSLDDLTYTFNSNNYMLGNISSITFTQTYRREDTLGNDVNSPDPTSKDIEFIGDGVTFLTVKSTLHYVNYDVIVFNQLYANKLLETSYYIKFNDSVSDYLRHAFQLTYRQTANYTNVEEGTAKLKYWAYNNDYNCDLGTNYINANSQRDDQSLPVYNTYEFFNYPSVGSNGQYRVGVTLSNTDNFEEHYVFTAKTFLWFNDEYDNDIYTLYNNFVGYATKNNYYDSIGKIHINLIKNLNGLIAVSNTLDHSSAHYKYFTPHIKYAEYICGKCNIYDVDNEFQYMMSTQYFGTTKQKINQLYQSISLAFIGRSLPLAYILYNEFKNIDNEKATYYSDIVDAYGGFLLDLYNDKNDIPLVHNSNVGNANSRAMGLYGLTLANKLNPSGGYTTAIEGVNTLINNMIEVGTIIPEGNIITSRYLPYTAFANWYYSMANVNYTFNTRTLTSLYNYIFTATHPTGEIKDQVLTSSDSRRGKPHTYAYIAGILGISKNPECSDLANKVVEWLLEQNPIYSQYPHMLDGYDTYTGSETATTVSAMALIALGELYFYGLR